MVVDSVATQPDVTPPNFYPNLFLNENILNLNKIYKNSIPFNFSIIKNLFDSKFLLKVKEELIKNVNFTEKETDICKCPPPFLLLSFLHSENCGDYFLFTFFSKLFIYFSRRRR